MIAASIAFSGLAAAAVWIAGRRDAARDPRLTVAALGLLAGFPLLFLLPEWHVLPRATGLEPLDFNHVAWLPWIWGTGVGIALLRLGLALAVLTRWRRVSEIVEVQEADGMKVEIRVLAQIAGPVAAGIFKPVVFVPTNWREWSLATREAVLAHEMMHHRRRDPLLRAVAAAACALHWYNPLAWWMARRLADQCEFVCDEAVIAEGVSAKHYATVLCDLAASQRSPATTLAMAHEGGLEARVKRMFSTAPRESTFTLAALLILTLLTALGLAVIRRTGPLDSPALPLEELRMRMNADPFPGE